MSTLMAPFFFLLASIGILDHNIHVQEDRGGKSVMNNPFEDIEDDPVFKSILARSEGIGPLIEEAKVTLGLTFIISVYLNLNL